MKTVTFVFIAVYAMMFASCPLEDNDALWEQVYKENLGDEGGGKGDNSGIVSGTNLAAKLEWLQTNARSGGTYTIEVSADEIIMPTILSYDGKSDISITLVGTDALPTTVSLSYSGSLFTVENGVTLILDSNITLQGKKTNNDSSLVKVNRGGTLNMNKGSLITGNTRGVHVDGTFTMSGGEISDNIFPFFSSAYGGGVFVGGTFTMSGGTISGNTATYGGGVAMNSSGATFTMSGGTISGNTAYGNGGGVSVTNSFGGVFIKTGGTIYGSEQNNSNSNIKSNGNVVKDISGTVRSNMGHAVYASSGGDSKRKETTAGPGVGLQFRNGSFSGGWDY